MSLTRQIVIAMIAAIVLGSVAQVLLITYSDHETLAWLLRDVLADGVFYLGGKIFMASIMVLVVPLVFVSLVCGVCHLGDQLSLGRISVKAIGLYLITTGIAISLALGLANVINPGIGVEISSDVEYVAPPPVSLLDTLANIFPTNPFQAMTEGKMLQVIVFALLIGIAIAHAGAAGERIAAQFTDWNAVLMKLVTILLSFAPYGVFSLLFPLFADQGIGVVGDLAKYMMTVTLVLLIHAFFVYPLILTLLTRLSPWPFVQKMRSVQLFAFSTASSTATIPVTLRNAEHRLGVNTRVASFVIPLGATINMDGTAIMQGVATVFIAQAFGLELSLLDYAMVVITAMLASIGTAGVPGVGLITLAMVLQQVGLPLEGIAMIVGVDRILDMMRTAVNVTGDSVVAVTVAHSEGSLNITQYQHSDAGEVR
ncbi:MAG: dicarboxylate/amino acid:cation symporter [Bacterioplanes sp.]|nr:dicarboxylate/amino acid:cation symporter [Bacterioplanes sp.]